MTHSTAVSRRRPSASFAFLLLLLPLLAWGFDNELLEPEVAFAVTAHALDEETVEAIWTIADGYYMYRERFGFETTTPGFTLGEPLIPPGEHKVDEFFGEVETYRYHVAVQIPVERSVEAGDTFELSLKSQGCADIGVCYPPLTQVVSVTLPQIGTAPRGERAAASPASQPQQPQAPPVSEQDRLASSLAEGRTWLVILTFFGLGLLLALTPCVFPMIPILSSIIIGQGAQVTTRRAFVLSTVFVLAMALTYTVAGVLAGLFGANLQATFQNPWILGAFSAIFVALALAMFGFYELQMPSFLQSKLTEVSNRQKGGTLSGVAVMGLLSALIVGPCVAAPLMGALIYIGQTGDAVLGGAALFALSMGMGLPLIAIGTSAGKLMPRAGAWMDTVKAVFGVLMLAVAIWMLERVLPEWISLILWALLLITSAVYMGALEPIREGASGWMRLWKGLGVALLLWGGLMLVGASLDSREIYQPLRGVAMSLASGGGGGAQAVAFNQVRTVEELERELGRAAERGQPVMVYYTADWCVDCRRLERRTFPMPEVTSRFDNAMAIKVDVTANNENDRVLLQRYGLIGPPGMIFYDGRGQEQRGYRLVGFIDGPSLADHARRAWGQ